MRQITSAKSVSSRTSIRRHLLIGVATLVLLVGGFGGWAATTEFAGAVIAMGQMVVESNWKKVQHPTGGVVGELKVQEGDWVQANDLLLRLDETQTKSNLDILVKGLDELAARTARAETELAGGEQIAFPPGLEARSRGFADLERLLDGERRLFEARRTAREGQKSQLRERVTQLQEEITGYSAQIAAKEREIEWITKELKGVHDLWKQNLVQFTRVTALERDAARIAGERGQLTAAVAQAKGKITETELQILQVDQNMRQEVGKELADMRAKIAELSERRVAAEDQLKRVELRAPQAGRVHQLDVHTVGGVVTPGQQIMVIVPEAGGLSVEAKIQPQDIDQLRPGQEAVLRFSSFNQRTTPEINGTVTRISPDVTTDPKTGINYYTVRIGVAPEELARLGDVKLVPGMPVEAFIQTHPRTVVSYLVKPLFDQITRAFREK